MKFDHDILFEFLPDEDKKSFMVCPGFFLNVNVRLEIIQYWIEKFKQYPFVTELLKNIS